MQQWRFVAPKAVLAALASCGPQQGPGDPIVTEPVWHAEVSVARVHGELAGAAITYLEGRPDVALAAGDAWQLISVHRGQDGLGHVRLQQTHDGVPVLGSEVAVHADETLFMGYAGSVTRNLDDFDAAPTVDASEAVAAAIADHPGGTIEYAIQEATLFIRPRPGEGADLVWQVELFHEVQQPGGEPGRWIVAIDARTGAVLDRYDALMTLEQASGSGGNPKRASAWTNALDVMPDAGGFAMSTDRLVTRNMMHFEEGDAPIARGASLIDFPDPVVNDAHGYTEITLDMMRDWMDRDSVDDAGMVIGSRVHYMWNYNNAYWLGNQVTYGDGDLDKGSYAFTGDINVVGHEINHGFTRHHSNLAYQGEWGGLNESFSDVAGTIAEYYVEGDDADMLFGADVTTREAQRFMCDPPRDEHSIDHLTQWDDSVNVHYSSGIGNKAFCLATARFRAATGGSMTDAVKRVGMAWYLANAGYWTSHSNFAQGCEGVIDAAHALGFSSEEVTMLSQSWEDVGVVCSGKPLVCDRDGTCDIGDGETCVSCSVDCGTCYEDCSWWKRNKCGFGLDDCGRCAWTDLDCGDGVCTGDETDENCPHDCGCTGGNTCGEVAPFGCWCDAECEARGDCCVDVEEACR
jgi:pseudolysin/vibriolysin